MSKLTEEQWEAMAEYYLDGHTLRECAVMWGISAPTANVQLKKRGVKMRRRFEPSRPEKAARMSKHILEQFLEEPSPSVDDAPPVQETVPEGRDDFKSVCFPVPEEPPKRKIIAVDDNDQVRYEKEIK